MSILPRVLILAALLLTLLLGVLLRWAFAGEVLPLLSAVPLGNVRHVHTHTGYYAVLFPLLWWSWQQQGERIPGRPALLLYASSALLALWGFWQGGYNPISIAGSTGVLVVWLLSAWNLRGRFWRGDGWLSSVAPGIVLGSVLVLSVAASGGGERAQELVQSFLGALLLLVLIPTALSELSAPAMPLLWLAGGVPGALSMGALESDVMRLGLALCGYVLVAAVWHPTRLSRGLRWAWGGLGIGLGLVGAGGLPLSHQIAVAGVHFAVLGPLLVSLSRPLQLPASPPLLRVLYGMALVGMCGAIGAQDIWSHPLFPRLAAWLGTVVALLWIGAVLWWGISHSLAGADGAGSPKISSKNT